MEVHRQVMSIVLSMTSSLNVEEAALFLNKMKNLRREARVLADGTYATETAYTGTSAARLASAAVAKPPLRSESNNCSTFFVLLADAFHKRLF